MTDAEPIYAALFGLASLGEGLGGAVSWTPVNAGDASTFAFTSRRVRMWDDLTGLQPALCQAEHSEHVKQVTNQPSITTLKASWMIFLQAPDGTVPAQTTNAVLTAIRALFVTSTPDGVQHLELDPGNTGWGYKCWIDGEILKIQGDLDGQSLVVVPVSILVP